MDENKLKPLVERVKEDSPYTFIYFGQVPMKTARDFMEFSESEYSGHFGFALKALMDGMVVFKNEVDQARIEKLEDEVLVLKNFIAQLNEDKKEKKEEIEKGKKRMDGSVK